MKVKVIKLIFRDGSRVQPGVIMDVPDDEQGDWFEKIGAKDAPKAKDEKPKDAPKAK